MKLLMALLFLQLLFCNVFGQAEANIAKKNRYVEVPREQVLLVVASQPESPLTIDSAVCLYSLEKGKTILRYRVQNRSSKPIASFTVVSWSSSGAGGTLPVLLSGSSPLLLTGGVLDSMTGEPNYDIVPMTPKLRREIKQEAKSLFEGKLRQIYFLLVDQVQFSDGSVFRDAKLSGVLSDFLSEHYEFGP